MCDPCHSYYEESGSGHTITAKKTDQIEEFTPKKISRVLAEQPHQKKKKDYIKVSFNSFIEKKGRNAWRTPKNVCGGGYTDLEVFVIPKCCPKTSKFV